MQELWTNFYYVWIKLVQTQALCCLLSDPRPHPFPQPLLTCLYDTMYYIYTYRSTTLVWAPCGFITMFTLWMGLPCHLHAHYDWELLILSSKWVCMFPKFYCRLVWEDWMFTWQPGRISPCLRHSHGESYRFLVQGGSNKKSSKLSGTWYFINTMGDWIFACQSGWISPHLRHSGYGSIAGAVVYLQLSLITSILIYFILICPILIFK